MYVLCGSKGCNSRAVKWSPDVVSRSAKWCETKVWDSAIVQSRAKVQDGERRNDETR